MQIAANFQAGQYQGMTLDEVLEAQVLKPRRAAQALFDGHAKLTRLVTFISPDEMKVRPTFIENSTLPDVSNLRTADATLLCGAASYSSCNAPMRISLPDGKSLYFKAPAGDGWCGNPAATTAGRRPDARARAGLEARGDRGRGPALRQSVEDRRAPGRPGEGGHRRLRLRARRPRRHHAALVAARGAAALLRRRWRR
jgi:hypothetical protein